MKHVFLALMFCLSACAGTVVEDYQGGPTKEQVARVETLVVMPPGSKSIRRYLRTYFVSQGKIVGQYVEGPEVGVRSVGGPIGLIFDGGCSVVIVTYDVASDRIEDASCNGVA